MFEFYRTYAVAPQTVVGAGFFRDFSLVAQSLDKPALTGFFILKCVSPVLTEAPGYFGFLPLKKAPELRFKGFFGKRVTRFERATFTLAR
jgi:hypothetical protein